MTKIDRRDFLLYVAPLVAAPALILGSVSEMEAQIKNFALRTPTNNAQVSVGQTVQISLGLIRTAYPKISRIDFKANNQIIGTSSTRPHQMNWQPTQSGNFALTAEAVLVNGTIITTPTVNIAVASSQLEVLYDTLGNATDGWGWAGQGQYFATVSNSLALNYFVSTQFIGTITTPKRLRSFEIAASAYNSNSNELIPWSRFLGHMWLGIWRADVGTFFQQPIAVGGLGTGSLTTVELGTPTVGSYVTPAGTFGTAPVYVFGWDNLNVLLPANVGLEISVQFEATQVLFDKAVISGSSRPGPNMRSASSDFGNLTIAQPLAARIKVSN